MADWFSVNHERKGDVSSNPIQIATRGSALALAQSKMVQAQCRLLFPELEFKIKIVKTTGDKLQSIRPEESPQNLPKGLFTKEIEETLLQNEATLAVHSLKDLPTELPDGLRLAATPPREDVRDVLIFRTDFSWPDDGKSTDPSSLAQIPGGRTVATTSLRRSSQILFHQPRTKIVPIRGNVGTRLKKLVETESFDFLVLAAAGLHRLGFIIGADGLLSFPESSEERQIAGKLKAFYISPGEMVPCVGQAAIGIETRKDDSLAEKICAKLNHLPTFQSTGAERSFLRHMGGGCISPIGAFSEHVGADLRLYGILMREGRRLAGQCRGEASCFENLGRKLAQEILRKAV